MLDNLSRKHAYLGAGAIALAVVLIIAYMYLAGDTASFAVGADGVSFAAPVKEQSLETLAQRIMAIQDETLESLA